MRRPDLCMFQTTTAAAEGEGFKGAEEREGGGLEEEMVFSGSSSCTLGLRSTKLGPGIGLVLLNRDWWDLGTTRSEEELFERFPPIEFILEASIYEFARKRRRFSSVERRALVF